MQKLKSLKWRFLDHPWLWWPKLFEIMNRNSHWNVWFIVNSGKSINLKTRADPFLYTQNDFLQHIARGIILGIIKLNVQRESRKRIRKDLLSCLIVIESISIFISMAWLALQFQIRKNLENWSFKVMFQISMIKLFLYSKNRPMNLYAWVG